MLKKLVEIMLGKSPDSSLGDLFRPRLKDFINLKHELIALAEKVNWKELEEKYAPLYSHTGTPAKPVRLMVGLLLLKQMYDFGDETIIAEWIQNPYMQYFCGEVFFQWQQPCDPSDLVHFRKRLGKEGVDELLRMSLLFHAKEIDKAKTALVDTTVQEKNITFPTDVKLQVKIIGQCQAIAQEQEVEVRQSYKRTVKKLLIRTRFSHHPKRQKQARKARRKIRTIAGRLVRELERKLDEKTLEQYQPRFEIFKKVLSQQRHSKNKIYSLHEPHVSCIAKGKAHKEYEFGSKVGLVMLPGANIITGVVSFQGNPNDSTTLEPCLEHSEAMTGKRFELAVVDRGYKGKKRIQQTRIIIPGGKEDEKLLPRERAQKRRLCRKRAAIEPIIGHIKYDCRMTRNYLKGELGDVINATLAATAFNLRQWIRKYRKEALCWLLKLLSNNSILSPTLSFYFLKTSC